MTNGDDAEPVTLEVQNTRRWKVRQGIQLGFTFILSPKYARPAWHKIKPGHYCLTFGWISFFFICMEYVP